MRALLGLALLACAVGCSDDEKPKKRAFVRVAFDRPETPGLSCPTSGNFLEAFSDAGDGGESSVEDGQKTAYFQSFSLPLCQIAPGEGIFNVNIQAKWDDTSSANQGPGSVYIQGQFSPATGPQKAFARFSRTPEGAFQQSDCVLEYVDLNGGANPQMGVASGRIWGRITCRAAEQSTGIDPKPTCTVRMEFKFENCDS